jgi:hypothetical protein
MSKSIDLIEMYGLIYCIGCAQKMHYEKWGFSVMGNARVYFAISGDGAD